MTPDRIEFWKNNTTPAYKLTKRLFEELAAIEPTDLEYENNSGFWNANYSAPCETESLVYRLRPDFVKPVKNEEDPPLKPWECHKDSPNGIGLKSGTGDVDTQRDVTYIGGVSELVAAGITADSVPNGIKIEGGVKNDKRDNKLPMELIPPETLIGYAEVMRMGAKKYAPNNWLLGIKYSRLYAATLRHLLLWFMGEDLDKESGLSHLKHTFWNIGALITFVERKRTELDDRIKTS